MTVAEFQLGQVEHRIHVDGTRSLLDQAMGSGIPVDFSCRRGDCGQCVASVLAGEVGALDRSRPLHSGRGTYLCNAVALSDVRIALPYFPELSGIRPIYSPAKIHALLQLGEEIIELVLRLPPAQGFKFLPGQFVRLTNKDRITRSYSLAYGSSEDRLLRIHIRRLDQGAFSNYLFSTAKPGDLLHLEGPLGHFFLRDADEADKTVFLATGVGIAPIHAILSAVDVRRRKSLGEISVFWGLRYRHEEYMRDAMLQLADRLGLRYHALYSRELDRGIRYVQDLMAFHSADLSNGLVFACGNPAMTVAALEVATRLNLPTERYRSDPFTSS